MKQIGNMSLLLNGTRFYCHDIEAVDPKDETEFVEVTIECTIAKKDLERLQKQTNQGEI